MPLKKSIFASGICLCGSVKYKITSSPVRMGQCHCDDCRKSTGTGHSSNAFFKKDDVVIEGETNSYSSVTDTGLKITRYVVTNVISVSAGTLDDSSWFKPEAIVYNKRKPKWDFMDESIPTFDEMPPPQKK